MKKGKQVWFIALIVIGLLTSGCLFLAFNASMVDVVVSTGTVAGNVQITSDMVTTKKVDKASLPSQYVEAEYLEDVIGKYTNIGLVEGGVVTTYNVSTESTTKAAIIPEGKTLLSIVINSLPQGVEAGDEVNLLVGASLEDVGEVVMTFQKVKVTNVYIDVDGNVTGLEIEVTPEQAQKIQYAQINGQLAITLLPLGYEVQNLPIIDEDGFKNYSNSSVNNNTNNQTEQNQ